MDASAATLPLGHPTLSARSMRARLPGQRADVHRHAHEAVESLTDVVLRVRSFPCRAEDSNLDKGGIETLPKDLFLVLRVTQMLRGLAHATEKAGGPKCSSLASAWRSHAKLALATRSGPSK